MVNLSEIHENANFEFFLAHFWTSFTIFTNVDQKWQFSTFFFNSENKISAVIISRIISIEFSKSSKRTISKQTWNVWVRYKLRWVVQSEVRTVRVQSWITARSGIGPTRAPIINLEKWANDQPELEFGSRKISKRFTVTVSDIVRVQPRVSATLKIG